MSNEVNVNSEDILARVAKTLGESLVRNAALEAALDYVQQERENLQVAFSEQRNELVEARMERDQYEAYAEDLRRQVVDAETAEQDARLDFGRMAQEALEREAELNATLSNLMAPAEDRCTLGDLFCPGLLADPR